MNLSDYLHDLGRPVSYYPSIARWLGLKESILLCNFIWWTGKQRDGDGWIYKSQAEIEEETALTPKQQVRARASLKARGFLEENDDRINHKMHYRVVLEAVNKGWGGYLHNGDSGISIMEIGYLHNGDSHICTSCTTSIGGKEKNIREKGEADTTSSATGSNPPTETHHPKSPPKRNPPKLPAPPPLPKLAHVWNEMAEQHGFQKCIAFSPDRHAMLRARAKDPFFMAHWREAIAAIPKSPFLSGQNDRGWKANMEFFLRPGTVVKIMEGQYDLAKPSGTAPLAPPPIPDYR